MHCGFSGDEDVDYCLNALPREKGLYLVQLPQLVKIDLSIILIRSNLTANHYTLEII